MAPRGFRLDRTLGPLVVRWIERELVHGPGDVQGQRIELDDERVRFILRAYRIDDAGRRVYRRAMLSRPKGWAKSEFAAMLGAAEALGPVRFRGWGEDGRPLGGAVTSPFIRFVATEEGQAGDGYAALEFMLRNGAISRVEGLDVGMTRTFLPDGGKIAAVSAKASSKDGGKETFVVFDETHLYTTPELLRLHSTIRRNLGKRRVADPWSLEATTMYAPGEGSVAEFSHAYARKIEQGKVADPSFLFDHLGGPTAFDFEDDEQLRVALMEAYGQADWMDFDRLIAECRDPQTDRSDAMRYFVNVPTRREELLYLKKDEWDVLSDAGSMIPEGATVCLGMDGSRVFDTTVVGIACRASDGRIDVDARVFSARADAPHHVLHSGKIDMDDVEGFIVDQFDRYRVAEAAYDPRYLDRSADILETRLPEAAIAAVEPQSRHMRDALQTLHRLVCEGRIRHRGDPVVSAHLANARVDREDVSQQIRRVVKLDQRKPIDAVIAIALAVWRMEQCQASAWPLEVIWV